MNRDELLARLKASKARKAAHVAEIVAEMKEKYEKKIMDTQEYDEWKRIRI
jgi:flagellar motor switch protein FliG